MPPRRLTECVACKGTQGLDLLVGTQCLPRLNVGQPLNVLFGARPIDLLVNRRMQGPDLLGERTRLAAQELET